MEPVTTQSIHDVGIGQSVTEPVTTQSIHDSWVSVSDGTCHDTIDP